MVDSDVWSTFNDIGDNVCKRICCGHSATRSWFISTLLLLIIQTSFMDKLREYASRADRTCGELLLFKIIMALQISLLDQDTWTLQMTEQFCEAFLQGHCYHWECNAFTPSDAFEILENMAPRVFDEFRVQFTKTLDRCSNHPNARQLSVDARAHSLELVTLLKVLDQERATLHATVQMSEDKTKCESCSNEGRRTRKIENYYFDVNMPWDKSWLLHVHNGVPESLVERAQNNEEWTIGFDPVARTANHYDVAGALFKDHGHWSCALLLINQVDSEQQRKRKKWYKFDTSSKKISKISKMRWQLEYVFLVPQEITCKCNQRFKPGMSNCALCETLTHTDCFAQINGEALDYCIFCAPS